MPDPRPAAAPRLETERLRLRGFAPGDVDRLVEIWAEPEVHRHITGRAFSRQEIWFRVLRSLGHWQLLGFGYWAVTDRNDDRVIGEMGFGDFKREGMAEIAGRPELGFVLASSQHGKGLAIEALRAIQNWGDLHLPGEENVAIISPNNVSSLRVVEKLGFARSQRIGAADDPVDLYVRRKAS